MSLRFTILLHRFSDPVNHPTVLGSAPPQRATRTNHLDYLFETDPSESSSLVTFASDGTDATVTTFYRLPDHRRRYLHYQGEVSGDRGRVDPMITGTHRVVRDTSSTFEIEILSEKANGHTWIADALPHWIHDFRETGMISLTFDRGAEGRWTLSKLFARPR